MLNQHPVYDLLISSGYTQIGNTNHSELCRTMVVGLLWQSETNKN